MKPGDVANDTRLLDVNVKNATGVSVTPIARGIRSVDATAGSPPGNALPNVTVNEDEPLVAAGKDAVPEKPAAIVGNVAIAGAAPTFTV